MMILRLVLLMLLVAVAPGVRAQTETPTEIQQTTEISPFQALLNRHDIPLILPPRGKSVVVNIPAFEVIAFHDAMPVFRSRAIVGTPWHRTPRLVSHVSTVRIRPTWRPTPSMVASGEYRDRIWPPGRSNPLGLAAVRLEPGLLVYLHDTNRRELFDADMRALSHGCVRVQRWDELVAWVLDIDLARVHALANGSRTRDLVSDPIPVFLGYYTEFPRDDGTLGIYDDIYGLGRSVAQLAPLSDPPMPACGNLAD